MRVPARHASIDGFRLAYRIMTVAVMVAGALRTIHPVPPPGLSVRLIPVLSAICVAASLLVARRVLHKMVP